MIILKFLFWFSLLLVFYTYLGYGILLWVLVKIKEVVKKPLQKKLPPDNDLPPVTLFIAAYNEQDVVQAKMSNSLALDYPVDKMTIMWVTDGSNDKTVELLRPFETLHKHGSEGTDCLGEELYCWKKSLHSPRIRVEHVQQRGGKAAAFNRGIDFVTTPIVIFTDANTMLNREAVKEIVREFTDEKVGCVAAEKRVNAQMSVAQESVKGDVVINGIAGMSEDAASTEGIYWKYESALKALDYRLYSAVGAAGELFAVRTNLYEKLGNDTLLDDFILSMRIAQRGYKIAYCSNAYAVEGTSANIKEEGKRKVRIAAGGLQSIGRLLPLLNGFKYGVLSFQYLSHRVLRWSLTPVCLLLLIPLNTLLVWQEAGCFYNVMLGLQGLFYLMGGAGWILSVKGRKNKILYVIYYFLFMNYNVFKGVRYLMTKKTGVWEKAKRK
ncbi:MAG: glycosyltransferase family 2 protein [Bacteroidales bacterium]